MLKLGRQVINHLESSSSSSAAAEAGHIASSHLYDGYNALTDGGGQDIPPPSFSSWLPPPYRVLLLLSLGLILTGANFHGLGCLNLDLWPLLKPPPPFSRSALLEDEVITTTATTASSTRSSSPRHSQDGGPGTILPSSAKSPHLHHRNIHNTHLHPPPTNTSPVSTGAAPFYLFGWAHLVWALLGWASYRYYVDSLGGDPRGRHAQTLQGISVLGAVIVMFWPGNVLNRAVRRAFGRALMRTLKPTLRQNITFSDVLLADILTSFAKVLGDAWLTACFLVPRKEHHTWWNGKGSTAVPLLTSLPYLIRLRQCLSEYNVSIKNPLTGKKPSRPLWNALKYASAFPVIWLSSMYGADKIEGDTSQIWKPLFVFWLFSVFVNSFYSFWWDVTNDWGLQVLQPRTWAEAPAVFVQGMKTIHRRGMSSVSLNARFKFSGVNGEEKRNEDLVGKGYPAATTSSSSIFPLASTSNQQNAKKNKKRHQKSYASMLDVPMLGDLTKLTRPPGSNALKPTELSSSSSPSPSPSSSSSNLHGNHQHVRSKSLYLRQADQPMIFQPWVYKLAIALDLVLRFMWSLKLSSHLHQMVELESGVFVLEALEIFRRWCWVFLRVEWEFIRSGRLSAAGLPHHQESGIYTPLEVDDDLDLHSYQGAPGGQIPGGRKGNEVDGGQGSGNFESVRGFDDGHNHAEDDWRTSEADGSSISLMVPPR